MMRIQNIIILAVIAVTALSVDAKVKLTSIWGDNMVLQQQSNVTFTGTAAKQKKVDCVTSWNGKKVSVKADADGKWELTIATPVASNNVYEIRFNDGEELLLNNILIGEVWFCSGQSNMEMPVKGFRGQPVYDSQKYIASSNPSRALRMFTVKNAYNTLPQSDGIEGKWSECNSDVVADFSATGYFFGDMLQRSLDIPVGLIQCAWSASKIEAWMSRDLLSQFSDVELPALDKKEFGWIAGTPTLLWNAMVNPWKGFPIKGVIWYQGEANSPAPEMYRKLFPAMVKEWRKFFNNVEMPFYYVQIAPWQSEGCDKFDWADFRQVQLELLSSLSHLGMVTTSDVGSVKFIHPPYKIKVGERLAYWALGDAYGRKGFQYCGPIYKCCKMNGAVVEVEFEHGEDGLNPENKEVEGFELVDDKGVIHPAKAEILNGSPIVKVWNDSVPLPIEVRYCYRNYMEGTLQNNAAIPASPFKAKINK